MHSRNGHLYDGRLCGIHAAPPRPMVSFSLLSSTLALDPPPLADEREEEAEGWFLSSHKVSFFFFFFFVVVVVGGVRCLPQRPTPPPPLPTATKPNQPAGGVFVSSFPSSRRKWLGCLGKREGKKERKKAVEAAEASFSLFSLLPLIFQFCLHKAKSILSVRNIQQGSLKFTKLKSYFYGGKGWLY